MSIQQTVWTATAVCALALVAQVGASAPEFSPVPTGPAEGGPFTFYDMPEPAYSASSPDVPVFNSMPGAHAKLFLDFDGVDFGSTTWGGKSPGQRPAFSLDSDTSSFSATELSSIEQIWSRVAEAFSMFNVNVTTVDPGNYNRRESAHLVISGNNTWYGGGGGVAYVGGFRNSTSMVRHTGWVFPGNLRGGDPKVVADAAIHEAGHLFGLNHQSTYADNGTRTEVYDDNFNSALQAPNLGVAYNAGRGLWAQGAATSSSFVINELSTIGGSSNAFGFVPDEPGVSFATAEEIEITSAAVRGIIERSTDVDYYKFELDQRSLVDLMVDVADFGPNLDVKLRLYNHDLLLLQEDDPTLSTSRESLVAGFEGELSQGVYYLEITSHGGYTYDNGPRDRFLEDTGQYFVSGLVTALAPEPAALWLLIAAVPYVARHRTS